MSFLSENELTDAIAETVKGEGVRIAVAFWGHDAPERLGLSPYGTWRIICNLSMGGTNPKAIRKLEDPSKTKDGETKRIKECRLLHAKVYLSDAKAVVCSANASANGLGHEGEEMKGWLEAGTLIDDPAELRKIRGWFDELWDNGEKCKSITDQMLKEAVVPRGHVRGARTWTVIDPEADDVPFVSWWADDVEWKFNKRIVEEQIGEFDETALDGTPIEGPGDQECLTKGRWMLWFKLNDNGSLSRNIQNVSWSRLGRVIKGALGSGEDFVVFDSEDNRRPPFKLTDDKKRALINILLDQKFEELRTYYQKHEYEGSWFTMQRIELMREFWREFNKVMAG